MLDVAIVEDDKEYAAILSDYLKRYGSEKGVEFDITVFNEAVSFIEKYRPRFSIIFMDIELPMMNGMDAARQLRQKDCTASIVFVTNMAQFACQGYEVSALDFIVKPVTYADFSIKLDRAVRKAYQEQQREYLINIAGGEYRVYVGDIKYIEVSAHKVIYHMSDGSVINSRNTLSAVEERLKGEGFLRCSKFCLVNPRHITAIDGLSVMLGKDEVFISRSKRSEFMQALACWRAGRQ